MNQEELTCFICNFTKTGGHALEGPINSVDLMGLYGYGARPICDDCYLIAGGWGGWVDNPPPESELPFIRSKSILKRLSE